jgi:hypothetical protein
MPCPCRVHAVSMPCPCRAHVVPLPCLAALIHTCHAASLPFSDSVVSFVKVRVVAGNIRTASPTVKRIGMFLITTFVKLRVVAGRSRKRAGRPHAVSGRQMLIHTCRAMPMPRCTVALRSLFQYGMVVAWHRRGKACENQTQPRCVKQMGKTKFKPLAARHGWGTTCCELALIANGKKPKSE